MPVVAATIAFGMGIDRASEFILRRLLMQRFCDKSAGGGVEALISLLPFHSLMGKYTLSNQVDALSPFVVALSFTHGKIYTEQPS